MSTIIDYCAQCDEPIYAEDERYEFPDGYVVCTECLLDWVDRYHRYGEVDHGYHD